MRVAFIGDIVGRPGREMIRDHLKKLKSEFTIDFVIANGENASHGFGMTVKNCDELLNYGIDLITGGNHSWDKKKDMLELLNTRPVLRPHNYPAGVMGSGIKVLVKEDEKLAVINLMGRFGMPDVENPFNTALNEVEDLHNNDIRNILIDFHAEATSEKRVMCELFKDKVSAVLGTHTHIGTDDLSIIRNCAYVTDVGLTGCRDGIIGMDPKEPINKAIYGIGGHFDIPKKCNKIFQMIVFDTIDGVTGSAFKLKLFNDKERIITQAIIEE
jgi:metallophosphoesterase (TIGR00282 family)